MTILIILLALPGVLAVLLRLGIALMGATKYSVEWYVARQISAQRAERGDLSGLAEARKIVDAAGRQQRRYILHAIAWVVLLALPLIMPAAVIVYPFYSLFWFLPNRSSRKPVRT
jgi:hypothetical protein